MIEINVEVETSVVLRRCSQEALDSFGSLEAVKVNGDLGLHRCTGLTELPDDLKVDGYLSLYGCPGIKKLPGGLSVNGDLDLGHCPGIKDLPEDLQVEGSIYYNEGTGFYGHMDEPGVIPDHLKNKLEKYGR